MGKARAWGRAKGRARDMSKARAWGRAKGSAKAY